MDSWFDVQFEVENAIREHLMENQKTLRDEPYVKKSLRWQGIYGHFLKLDL